MQMVSICVCHTYADARHMDMLNLCCILSFPGQIRKKLKTAWHHLGQKVVMMESPQTALVEAIAAFKEE